VPKQLVPSRHSLVAVRTALLYLFLALQQSYAQSRDVALGHFRSLSIPERFERFTIIPSPSSSELRAVLWNPGGNVITIVTMSIERDSLLSASVVGTRHSADDVMVRDIDADERSEIIVVHRRERTLGIYAEAVPDSFALAREIRLPVVPAGSLLADVTSDGHLDLLLFERTSPGLHLMSGDGKGNFRPSRVIAQDNMIGWIDSAQLNDDNLADIILYDWVRGEMLFLYGVGRGRFLEQTILPVDGNLLRFSVERLSPLPVADLVLLHQHPPAVEVWQGDGYGDFKSKNTFRLTAQSVDYAIADVNGDGWKDLVLLEGSMNLVVYLSAPSEPFAERREYFLGGAMNQMVALDVNHDRRTDVVMLSRLSATLGIVFNGNAAVTLRDSLEFLVGRNPTGVQFEDVDSDGYHDILVLSNGSGTLNLFEGKGEIGIYGQKFFNLPTNARTIAFHSRDDSTTRYVLSYPTDKSISYFGYNHRRRSTVNATIPEVGELEVLYSSVTASGRAEFYCFNAASMAGIPSLSYFQELENSRFIERSFRLTIPDLLYGASVGDLDNDGLMDAVVLYRNTLSRKYELAVLRGDSVGNFSRRSYLKEILQLELRKSYLYLTDLDHDKNLDLIICFPESGKLVAVARGNGDGTFGEMITIASPTRISDRAQIQIYDVNEDSYQDILINDLESGGVLLCKNRGAEGFDLPIALISGSGISHFSVADINEDGVPDLGITLRNEGRLKIYDGRRIFAGVRNE